LIRTSLKESRRKAGIQEIWRGDRTDAWWGFHPQTVTNDYAKKMAGLSLVSLQSAAQPQRKTISSLRSFDGVF